MKSDPVFPNAPATECSAGFSAILDGKHIRIPLLALGKGWLAVDKPAGLTVHNLPGKDLCSVVREGMERDAPAGRAVGYESSFGIHPVHRLDREASGVILLGCDPRMIRELSTIMQSDETIKRYRVMLHGRLPAPTPPDAWVLWSWPLTRSAGGRSHPAGKGKKSLSLTRIRVIRHTDRYTLADCELMTGRKHQIRRHAKMAGHAVVGDDRYGTRRSVEFLRDRYGFDRLVLHAVSLTIRPPGESSPVDIESPGLPEIMQSLLDD